MNRLKAYAQLVRLPNLPSALADIMLGVLVTGSLTVPGRWPAYLLLMLASVCLYCGGMAWNDFFDLEQDRRERPERPIPSGRITPFHAAVCAAALVAAGVLFAFLSGLVQSSRGEGSYLTPTVLALLLTGAIFLYDAWLKRTAIGPLGMGACRFLNVLLGITPVAALLWSRGLYLAIVVGLYIVGVTWLARTEARASSRSALIGAASVILLSLLMVLPLPTLPLPVVPPADASSLLFPYLLVGLAFFVGFPVVAAIRAPTPARVQSAVKRSLMGLILLDMVLATALAGSWGLVLVVLMAPSVYLNRRKWLYAT
jgi:1,4-dihydroxy-2-naphthoate octaprenyltransferase